MKKLEFMNQAQAKRATGVSYIGSINSSAKLIKNKKVSNNYTYVIYLAPANTSGYNVCAHSTPECRLGCLATSGRVIMEIAAGTNTIQNARIKKTQLLFENQEYFMQWVVVEMAAKQLKAEKDGYEFSARLNGTSDIAWEDIRIDGRNIFETFPEVQFYDYTKNPARILKEIAPNYQLTLSYTGKNTEICTQVLAKGKNVAVIFDTKKGQPLPETWNGFPVIDGDLTDYRPGDGAGVVVGLRFKRISNKADTEVVLASDFVVSV